MSNWLLISCQTTCPRTAVGKGYDITGILGFLFKTDIHNPNKFFCTELLYWNFYKIGKELLNNTEAYEATAYLILKSPFIIEDKEMNEKLWNHYGWKK